MLSDLAKHCAHVADVFEDATKALSKFSQKWVSGLPSVIEGEFSSSASTSLNGLAKCESLMLKSYMSFGDEMRRNVVQPMNDFVSSSVAEQKRLQSDYSHLMKQYNEACSNVSKLHSKYVKACAARDKKDSGPAEQEQAEQAYRSSIASCNRFHNALFSQSIAGCHSLLHSLEERDKVLKRSLQKLSSIAEGVVPHEAVEELAKAAESIFSGGDFDRFASFLELCCHPPHSVYFDQYQSTPKTPCIQGDVTGAAAEIPKNWQPTEISLLRMPLEAVVLMQQLFGRDGPSSLPYGLKWLLDTISDLSSKDGQSDLAIQTVPHDQLLESVESFGRGDLTAPKSAVGACEILKVFLHSLPDALIPEALCNQIQQHSVEPMQLFQSLTEPRKTTFGCIMSTLQDMSQLPNNSPESVADGFALCCMRVPQMKNDPTSLRKMAVSGRQFMVRLLTEVDFSQFGQLLAGSIETATVTALSGSHHVRQQSSVSAGSATTAGPGQRGRPSPVAVPAAGAYDDDDDEDNGSEGAERSSFHARSPSRKSSLINPLPFQPRSAPPMPPQLASTPTQSGPRYLPPRTAPRTPPSGGPPTSPPTSPDSTRQPPKPTSAPPQPPGRRTAPPPPPPGARRGSAAAAAPPPPPPNARRGSAAAAAAPPPPAARRPPPVPKRT